jgi:hypothetical protein
LKNQSKFKMDFNLKAIEFKSKKII